MARNTDMVFSALHLPRPLSIETATQFLARLAADRDGLRVVFEARADESGTYHLLGCRETDVQSLRRLLGDLIPGGQLTAARGRGGPRRPSVDRGARLRMRPPGLSLLTSDPEATTRAVLASLAVRKQSGEHLVIQVALGPRRAPRILPKETPVPGRSLLAELLGPGQPASTDVRSRLKERAEQSTFAATIRLGVGGDDRDRTRRFMTGMLSALSTTQSPGVHLDLVRQSPEDLDAAKLPWRWPLRLTALELLGLLAFPLGDSDLPGLPPAHPRMLRAASHVHSGKRVFALSAAPGDDRQLGISAKDQTFHGVAYGPSGSGKTNALLHLILADIAAGRPVAVLDPKRQLIDDILARADQKRWPDIVELNAADPTPTGFNPLDVTGRDPDVVVDGLMAVFEAVFSDGWGPRTADIFSASLRTLAHASVGRDPATLVDLPKLLTDSPFRRTQVGRVQHDVALAGFWAWYDGQSPAAQAASVAAPMNKLRQFLLRPALARMLAAPTDKFRLRDIFRQNKVVLVPLNEALIGSGTAGLLGSLVVAELWQATQERASDPLAHKRPGVVYVDEAPRFLNLPVSLADALAVSRSLSVGWLLAAQFRGQFPATLRSAVDMNARSKLQFATEYEDAREAAKLARELSADDFVALPKFHAYANLVADGHPSGWALVKTLPPPPAIADPDEVRAIARANYASPVAAIEPAAAATSPEPPTSSATPERIGRKRRSA